MKHLPVLLFMLTTALVACQRKFNEKRWRSDGTIDSRMSGVPERAAMVRDLLASHPLTGKDTAQVIQLLGPPDAADSALLIYYMVVRYDGIDPVYTKSFQVKVKNGIALNAAVVTWDAKEPE